MTNMREIPEGTVTVLFTDLVESTRLNQLLGDERAREVSRSIEGMARRLVESHKGVLIKEMGDGLMAVFPSARRAITSGREIQAEMRRMHQAGMDGQIAMRIGLHTGEVIAEAGDVHGETVIIAKRIEGLAPPGGVLVSETVHGVLGTARDELVDFGVAELKGIDAQWRLYLVPALADEPDVVGSNAPTTYVGRAAERAQLDAMVAAAAQGRGGMVLVAGEAGLGKSRITRETVAGAARRGMMVLTGHCLDMVSPPPYQPHIDQIEEAARETSPEGLRGALGENAPEVAKLMPSLRQRYDDIPAPPELAPEQERRYMLHGVGQFIERAAANRPLVLVFEDLHWADESTLLLLRHIGPRLAHIPLLVIGTYRPDELDADRPLTTAIGPLKRDVGATEIRLRRLDRDQVAAVLESRAGQVPPAELVDLVVDETQGNPFFVEEVFRHLFDAGKLFEPDGRWRNGFAIGETEVPQGVRLILERRLDQLDPEHRKILGTAAVTGRVFAFEALAVAAAVDEDTLFDVLEAAERLHLIEEVPAERDASYVFVQEQIRQTLLGQLSLPRRHRLHLRIADALEAGSTSPSPIEIAHHLYQAGQAAPAERTVAALLAAADEAQASLAFEDALRHLERAELLVPDELRPTLRSAQARALRGSGRVDDALALLDEELASPPDDVDRTRLRLQRIQLLLDQYRAQVALEDIGRLLEEVDAGEHADIELEVRLANGRAHYILSLDNQDHAMRARVAYEQAYTAAADRGDKRSMALALLPTTWFTDYWTDYGPTAKANVEEALRLAEEIGDADLALDARAAALHRIGVADSLESSERLRVELEARHDPVRLNAHSFWLMWEYYASGRFADCVAACDRGMELADLIGTSPVQYGSIKALALTDMGRFDAVEGALAEEVTDDDHPFGQAMAIFARSAYFMRLGAWTEAGESLRETIERATSLSRVWMSRWAASMLAVAAAELRRGGVTDPDPDALAALAADFGDWSHGATGAQIALVGGRPADALALAQRSSEGELDHDRVVALDIVARAHLALGDHGAALDSADRGLCGAEPMGFDSLAWRLRFVRAAALDGLGRAEDAAADREGAEKLADTLTHRIAEPGLQESFRRLSAEPSVVPPVGEGEQ
ncbi:MAG: hypothetical protein JWM05_1271 [Acidimicrobiales bacterium]|nr:hypothetical protein [Acidimicrobiales bacterium]